MAERSLKRRKSSIQPTNQSKRNSSDLLQITYSILVESRIILLPMLFKSPPPPHTRTQHSQDSYVALLFSGVPYVVWESPFNVLWAAYQPYSNPPPHPTNCIHVPCNVVAHNHACTFLFSESHISLPQIQETKHVLPQDSYISLLYSWVLYVTPSSMFGPD